LGGGKPLIEGSCQAFLDLLGHGRSKKNNYPNGKNAMEAVPRQFVAPKILSCATFLHSLLDLSVEPINQYRAKLCEQMAPKSLTRNRSP